MYRLYPKECIGNYSAVSFRLRSWEPEQGRRLMVYPTFFLLSEFFIICINYFYNCKEKYQTNWSYLFIAQTLISKRWNPVSSCMCVRVYLCRLVNPQGESWGSQCVLRTTLSPVLVSRYFPGHSPGGGVTKMRPPSGWVLLHISYEGHQDSFHMYGIWGTVYPMSAPESLVARGGSVRKESEGRAFGTSSRCSWPVVSTNWTSEVK